MINFISNLRKKNKGFTLLELMVVIGVLAILMLAAVPYFLGAQQDAEVNNSLRDAKTLEDAAMQEYVDPNVEEWTDGIADGDTAVSFDYEGDVVEDFGLEEEPQDFYAIEESLKEDNTQRIYNALENYGIATDGAYEGYVFILEPEEDSDGVLHIHPDFNNDVEENGEQDPEETKENVTVEEDKEKEVDFELRQ